jgi:hypothetical protein
MANFGRGLKEQRESGPRVRGPPLTLSAVDKNAKLGHRRGRSVGAAAGLSMATNPNRMSID